MNFIKNESGMLLNRDLTVGLTNSDNIDASKLDTIPFSDFKEGFIEKSISDPKLKVSCLMFNDRWGYSSELLHEALKAFYWLYYGKRNHKTLMGILEEISKVSCIYSKKDEAFPLIINAVGDIDLIIAPRVEMD